MFTNSILKEELLNIVVDNNKTESKVDDSKKIIFAQQNITIQSKNFSEQKWDFLIALLIQEKVIDAKGEINLDNLKRFKAKHDEKDINKTMRDSIKTKTPSKTRRFLYLIV
ncbi:hypothetical protein GCM10022386_10150 [Flavobacterium cheonhonense]|uniref:Uncharacterized protein n=1 Tax=Flavobacterium cheonhonense TaxID=706185 RepID=A0ABP7TMI6_9FLAO|nr:hypothetical protein [Flavobacterium cheonhonense]